MTTPLYALVINTGKHTEHLYDGHGDSVSIAPTPHHLPLKILYKFIPWAPLPNTIKITNYILNDGSMVTSLPSAIPPVAPSQNAAVAQPVSNDE